MRGTSSSSGNAFGERGEPLASRKIEHVLAVQMQAVEEERRERDALAQRLHVAPAAEPAHGHLERVRPAPLVERDHLAVEDRGARSESPRSASTTSGTRSVTSARFRV